MKEFLHCPYCGTRYRERETNPSRCASCHSETWRNPIPVAVILQPIFLPDQRIGLIGIRRRNTVQSGKISLPGGFVNFGETCQEAAAREAREEANLSIDPSRIGLFDTANTDDGIILIFSIAPPLHEKDLMDFVPNFEASERLIVHSHTPLAWPIHQRVCVDFLSRHAQTLQPL